jgi:predicted enzyme related to lactoylglutathione lyase
MVDRGAPRETRRPWVEVTDARAFGAALQAKGVALIGEPRELFTGWVIEVADPWGNLIGFTDYVKMPDQARK